MVRFLLPLLVVSVLGCTPPYTVKPLPNFIETAIAPGDKIRVTTQSGEVSEFIVSEFADGVLYGAEQAIAIDEIKDLKKLAWRRPKSPCGGEKPLGCSVPLYVVAISETHTAYGTKFYDACAQHDYCYRHGQRTYGVSRRMCDEEFLQDMQAMCPRQKAGGLGRALEMIGDPLESHTYCMAMANDFYRAVRDHGEVKFETTNSSYCEYDGAPPPPSRS